MIELRALACVLAVLLASCCPGSAHAQDPVSDDFERPSLGPDWTVIDGDPRIVNSSDLGSGPGQRLNLAVWSASAFNADQFSECEMSSDFTTNRIQVFVRRRGFDKQRYGFFWIDSSVNAQFPAGCNPGWPGGFALKLDGAPAAPYLACFPDPAPPGAGDTLRIEVEGTDIRGFYNDVLVASTSDTVLNEAGQPGVVVGVDTGGTACERWAGGTFVPEPSVALLRGAALLALGGVVRARRHLRARSE